MDQVSFNLQKIAPYNAHLPNISFDKMPDWPPLSSLNLDDNPHEQRFESINIFPSILSRNKKIPCLVKITKTHESRKMMIPAKFVDEHHAGRHFKKRDIAKFANYRKDWSKSANDDL